MKMSQIYRILLTLAAVAFTLLATALPSHAQTCATKSQGDANCDGKPDLIDYEIWRREYLKTLTTTTANFNTDTGVDLIDYEIWRKGYAASSGTTPPVTTATTTPGGGTTPPVTPGGGNSSYAQNLQMILSSPYRNTSTDDSPYLNTPSSQLPVTSLYGPWSEYKQERDDMWFQTADPVAGEFRTFCEFSHFAYDDPIVYPNKPGAAHLHMFFGNTHVNAFTTFDKLFNTGGGTCNGMELNRTGYWVPAVIDGSSNVRIPIKVLVYYKAFGAGIGKTNVYPENMQIISRGEANEMSGGPDEQHLSFMCNTEDNGNRTNYGFTMPTCNGVPASEYSRAVLEMNVKFQNCWNGQDPSNYKANLTLPQYNWYSGQCPSSHSKYLPNLEYRIFYAIEPNENTSSWFISSDVDPMSKAMNVPRGDSYHGDWWGAWNKEVNQTWVDTCTTVTNANCQTGQLIPSTGTALKIREQYVGPYKIPGQQLYNAICKIPKTISKPADLAYCDPAVMLQQMMPGMVH